MSSQTTQILMEAEINLSWFGEEEEQQIYIKI